MTTSNRLTPILLTAPPLLALLVGCQSNTTQLELVSYKDPYFPETFAVKLDTCVFRQAPGGDLHVAAHVERPLEPTDAEPTPSMVAQYLHIHMFWRPRPGRTHANETTTDAVIEYAIVNNDGLALYRGAGFVYPRKQKNGRLVLDVEDARLKLDRRVGTLPEVLGDARLTGTIVAYEDTNATVDLMRQLELYANGARELPTAEPVDDR